MAKLRAQVRAFDGLPQILDKPGTHTLDAEAQLVYRMKLSPRDDRHSTEALQTLEKLLPGLAASLRESGIFVAGSSSRRSGAGRCSSAHWRNVARGRRQSGGCPRGAADRRVDERCRGGMASLRGHNRSTLWLNPAALTLVGAAIDVACHEGYPIHHAQFVVMEAHAGPGNLPVEVTVVLLRSPLSMLREGAANYGVESPSRPPSDAAFEGDVLCPARGSRSRAGAEVPRSESPRRAS